MAIAFDPNLADPVPGAEDEADPQPSCPDCGRGLVGAQGGYLACGQLDLADPNVQAAIGALNLPSSHGGTEVIACGEHEVPDPDPAVDTAASPAELDELGL